MGGLDGGSGGNGRGFRDLCYRGRYRCRSRLWDGGRLGRRLRCRFWRWGTSGRWLRRRLWGRSWNLWLPQWLRGGGSNGYHLHRLYGTRRDRGRVGHPALQQPYSTQVRRNDCRNNCGSAQRPACGRARERHGR